MSSMMRVFCKNFSCLPEIQPSVPMRERGGIAADQCAAKLAAARALGLVNNHEPAFILNDGTSPI